MGAQWDYIVVKFELEEIVNKDKPLDSYHRNQPALTHWLEESTSPSEAVTATEAVDGVAWDSYPPPSPHPQIARGNSGGRGCGEGDPYFCIVAYIHNTYTSPCDASANGRMYKYMLGKTVNKSGAALRTVHTVKNMLNPGRIVNSVQYTMHVRL